jgi:glycine/D-amino acid oxidase-like deaminating enzyme
VLVILLLDDIVIWCWVIFQAGTLMVILFCSHPRQFCEFLFNRCKERNVTVLNPVTATSVTTDVKTGLPVTLSYTTQEFSEHTIPCTSLLLAAGPWTGRVYKMLFPKSEIELPITNLAGWSVVFRDLTQVLASTTPCHSVFTTSGGENFCPEVFSRIQPVTSEDCDSGREIYLAGLNSSEIPLPNIAAEVETPELYDPHIKSLLRAARRIFTPTSPVKSGENATDENGSLEVLRTGLCHRPVTPNGLPILMRLDPWHYAPHLASLAGNAASDAGMKGGGLFVCAGHGPWGIALSLGSGKVCADLIMGHTEAPIYSSQLGS